MENDWLGIDGVGREASTTLAPTMRSVWLSALLGLSILGVGCSESDTPATNGDKSPVSEEDDDADKGDDEGDDDDAPAAKPDAGKTTTKPDTGSTGTAKNDAGSKPPSLDGSFVSSNDAGTTKSDASTGTGGGPTAKPTLPSPNDEGPYKIVVEDNVGKGFENPINSNDATGPSTFCYGFVSLFGQDEKTNMEYSAVPAEYNMALYTLYRPEVMPEGQTFPVLSWANGTCAHTVGYQDMLKHVASHGFIVIATHSRFTASGKEQLRGVDYVIKANDDPESPLYKHVDTEKVGLFGHSQGGGSTGVASKDPRVDTSILMNGGTGANLHAPGFFMTGSEDSPSGPKGNYNSTKGPAAFGSLKGANHITMMTDYKKEAPEVVAWFRYQLLDDAEAKTWFVGADCLLCKDSEWEYLSKELK